MALPVVIKHVTELHQLIKHRDRLEMYEEILKDFDFQQKEEDLTATSNYYQGCILTIKDDKRREFELRNPVLIAEVVDYLTHRLGAKRIELESQIVLPNVA